eukprot:6487824-Amphidinium_carterae.3
MEVQPIVRRQAETSVVDHTHKQAEPAHSDAPRQENQAPGEDHQKNLSFHYFLRKRAVEII